MKSTSREGYSPPWLKAGDFLALFCKSEPLLLHNEEKRESHQEHQDPDADEDRSQMDELYRLQLMLHNADAYRGDAAGDYYDGWDNIAHRWLRWRDS